MIGIKRKGYLAVAAVIAAALVIPGITGTAGVAYADSSDDYGESYRNQLAYSALEGWNNDPNGLLYVNGTWHMYYQYNYSEDGTTSNEWGNMSWGHATSTDLVHWTEQEVAIKAYQNAPTGEGGADEWYAMMFSGSAVYDEYNTSGLFTDCGGSGIVAILTQPKWDEELQYDVQRQILAYSTDGGYSFSIYGEILGPDDDGGMGDNEFRDPRVFWCESQQKWLMAVGGGLIRMYSSDNLIDWDYLGSTGYWGECPDISCYTVNGEEKYVLIMSPEDKTQSHYYNGTSRADTFYPGEYYVVGHLDESGLFVGETDLQRLSYGFDSYAFQSFNNSPDGKVYGVSWAASWKNVGEYESYRENYNGGMTLVCELNLTKDETGAYILERTPVQGYEDLRGEALSAYSGTLKSGENALEGTEADIFELQTTVDFSSSSASQVQVGLRMSGAEQTMLTYDVASQTLTFDRSESSLLAAGTTYYNWPIDVPVALEDGKLNLQIICDRAFVSVFANGKSLFSAIFPSAVSNGMELVADGSVKVTSTVWALSGIFGDPASSDELWVTTDKLDMTVGQTAAVIASSYGNDFNAADVSYTVSTGEDYVTIEQSGETAYITGAAKGYSQITVTYEGTTKYIDVYVYEDGYTGDISYPYVLSGFTLTNEDGIMLSSTEDSFLFSDTYAYEFVYSADVAVGDDGQACGLVFGAGAYYYDYFVATADFANNTVKVWRAGVGDVATASYDFGGATACRMTLTVNGGAIKVTINDDSTAALVCGYNGYAGGMLGFNAYNSSAVINNVSLKHISGATYSGTGNVTLDFSGYNVTKVVNITDGSYRLTSSDYTSKDGVITIQSGYLSTLSANESYSFRIVTDEGDFTVTVTTDFEGATAESSQTQFAVGDAITINVSGYGRILGIRIDGTLLDSSAYSVEDGVITISAEAAQDLSDGSHTVTVLTENGRPETTVTISEHVISTDEDSTSNHLFFWIDIAIFAVLIVVFVAIAVGGRARKKKKKKEE